MIKDLEHWAERVLDAPMTGDERLELHEAIAGAIDGIRQTAWDYAMDTYLGMPDKADRKAGKQGNPDTDYFSAACWADENWRNFVADGFESLV